MKKEAILLSTVIIIVISLAHAQTNISGTINTYIQVTGYTPGTGTCDPAGSQTLTVSSTAGLSKIAGTSGNKVLIIQMTAGGSGAVNNGAAHKFASTYGAVTNYGCAGNYEFAFIDDIVGTNITFTKPLVNVYDPTGNGKVQIIPVVLYPSGVNTSGIVTGQAWNGSTGGVLLLESSTLTMNHNLSVGNRGFRGGVTVDRSAACCNRNAIDAPGNRSAYYFDETASGGGSGCSAGNARNYGNEKGEGIFPLLTNQMIGRGAFSNGGGGGSGHNSGGGGGGNCGAGGRGGYEYASCSFEVEDDMGGFGGYAMPNGATAVFMGGGGGAGNGNDNGATSGGNGGGIIILNVSTINVTVAGLVINANGIKPATALSDGAGGGGGGGAILLKVDSFTGSPLTVTAVGGNGGDNSSAGTCHAPGGGGGSGYIKASAALPIAGVTVTAAAGTSGIFTVAATQTSCGAYGGTTTASCPATSGLVLNEQTCTLPVEWLAFYAKNINKNNIELTWKTASEINNAYFEILRSQDGLNWEMIDKVTARNKPSTYSATDKNLSGGLYYYKIKQVDLDGKTSGSSVISVKVNACLKNLMVIPNSISQGESFNVLLNDGNIVRLTILDLRGALIFENDGVNENNFSISSLNMKSGCYFIHVFTGEGEYLISKLIVH